MSHKRPTLSQERYLQVLSNKLTHVIFRDGIVEDLHAANAPLDDHTMKILNKDVNDRIYTLLSYTFRYEEYGELMSELLSDRFWYDPTWDEAKLNDNIERCIDYKKKKQLESEA